MTTAMQQTLNTYSSRVSEIEQRLDALARQDEVVGLATPEIEEEWALGRELTDLQAKIVVIESELAWYEHLSKPEEAIDV